MNAAKYRRDGLSTAPDIALSSLHTVLSRSVSVEMAVDTKGASSILVNYLILIVLLLILWAVYCIVSLDILYAFKSHSHTFMFNQRGQPFPSHILLSRLPFHNCKENLYSKMV